GLSTVAGVAGLPGGDFPSLLRLTPAGIERRATGSRVSEAGLRLGPCAPPPSKIICIGLNYRRHAEETGAQVPDAPILFSKFSNSLAACGEEIPLPAVAELYDYEAELGVVIGRPARNVGEAQALDHVCAYSNSNHVT